MVEEEMGRPKKYTAIFIQKEAQALLAYAKATAIPFEKEFASKRGYSSQRISEFANISEEFSDALKKMKDIQEVKIFKAALWGKINPTMAIFTLKNVAGWRDVSKIDSLVDHHYQVVYFGKNGETEDSVSPRARGVNIPIEEKNMKLESKSSVAL